MQIFTKMFVIKCQREVSDILDDNGMQRYFDANDDEAWDWYAISFSSEYRETLKDQKKKRPCHERTARTFLL